MTRALFLLLCLLGGTLVAATRPFEDYKTIIDRQMFGAPPKGFDPTKMPSDVAKANSKAEQERNKAEEKIKRAIRFSVLNVTADGEIMVGFTDQRDAKNPLNYYMRVGETRNGWTVAAADRNEATMTIVDSEGIEVTLRLGGDSASDPNSVRNAVADAVAQTPANANALPRARLLHRGGASLRAQRKAQEEAREAEDDERRREVESMRAQLQTLASDFHAARQAQQAAAAKTAAEAQAQAAVEMDEPPDEPPDGPPGPPPPDDAMDAGDGADGH